MIAPGERLTFIDEDIRKHNPTVAGLTALMDGECIIRIETIRGGLKYTGTLDGALTLFGDWYVQAFAPGYDPSANMPYLFILTTEENGRWI